MKSIIRELTNRTYFSLRSQGISMMPVLYPDDIIYYKKLISRYNVYDIVLIKKVNNYLTHRIIYKNNGAYITKGDNNTKSDGKIYPRQIIAKVTGVKRNNNIITPENLYLLQSTLYFQEIVKVKKAFEREEIDFVFLKGLPHHLFYEKTNPSRIYYDCDILVDRTRIQQVRKILESVDYKQIDNLLSNKIVRHSDEKSQISYYKLINNFPIVFDIHLEAVISIVHLDNMDVLYPLKLIDKFTVECLNNKKNIIIQGFQFPILTTPYLIIYLALHFFHHNFQGAFRLEFLDKVTRRSRVNWKKELEIIKQYKLQNFVYPAFLILNKYYHTPIRNKFLKIIQPFNPLTRKFVYQIIKTVNIFDDEPRIQAGITRFKNLFFLSPNPIWKRLLVFINPQVVYSVFWVFRQKLFSFFSDRK